jgi:hypothetical protein
MRHVYRKRSFRLVWVMVAGVIFLGHSTPAFSECAFVGDLMWDVVRNCGEPTQVEVGQERIIGQYFIPHRMRDGWLVEGPVIGEVPVDLEQWVYNLGPTRFVRILTFQNGILKSISHGGYGH